MFKIAISGKANSGKDTLAKIIKQEIQLKFQLKSYKQIAFADPIKKMVSILYPEVPRKYLMGSSKFRSEVIPGHFKNNSPLTIRQVLIDLGTQGRQYNTDIWVQHFERTFLKAKEDIVIVSDVRYSNEFTRLKNLNFYTIRIIRNSSAKINHESETNQEEISDQLFDQVISNNGSLRDLKYIVHKIVQELK